MLLSLRKSHSINFNTYQDVFLYWHVPILLLFVILDGIDTTLFSKKKNEFYAKHILCHWVNLVKFVKYSNIIKNLFLAQD